MKSLSVFNQDDDQTNAHKIKCRVLIVCEGLKTEPNYFKSFHMMKNSGGLVFEITNDRWWNQYNASSAESCRIA